MSGLTEVEIADRPIVAFVATAAVAGALYAAFQLAFDGRVNVLESGLFALAIAAILVALSLVRRG